MEILTEPALYFASELDEAIQGSDWDEETVVVTSPSTVLYWAVQVIRVMVSRAEVDLRLVADRYHRLSGRQLDKAITVEFCLQQGAPLFNPGRHRRGLPVDLAEDAAARAEAALRP